MKSQTSELPPADSDGQLQVMLQTARIAATQAGPLEEVVVPLSASKLESDDLTAQDAELLETGPAPQLEGYDIEWEISSGGQATVFKGIQRSTGQAVAVKVLPGGRLVGSRRRQRFEREAQVLATLTHPNIVGIIDRGAASDGSLYLVMDYIDGSPLDRYVSALPREGDFARTVIELFIKVCEAVEDAHRRGIVHRDLKPSNIRIDRRGEPHVLDFGLARILDDDDAESRLMTMAGQMLGSLPWASPEQAVGGANTVDVRSDVYSLGVTLYQLITARFPYPVEGSMPSVVESIIRAKVKPPTQAEGGLAKYVDERLDLVVLKALEKSPDNRYPTAGALAAALQNWLDHRTSNVRLTRPAKRPSVWLAGCLLIVCIVAALLPFRGQFVAANRSVVMSAPRLDAPRAIRNDAVKSVNLSTGTIHTNDLGMQFAYIPAGEFAMGSPEDERPRQPDEMQHQVRLTKPFYMAVTPVTREQYSRLMHVTPGDVGADNAPVTFVTWTDARNYCTAMNHRGKEHYRLPTEAEWEYACRAGTTSMIAGTGRLIDMGWSSNECTAPQPVATKAPNAWGLYDMHGNVSQWCQDHYKFFTKASETDPPGPTDGTFYVARGGSFVHDLLLCRSAARRPLGPKVTMRNVGFRLAMDIPNVATH